MKTRQFLPILTMVLFVGFLASCSKKNDDVKPKFNYDLNILYGRWHVTHIKTEPTENYISVVGSIQEAIFPPTYITFSSDGTFSGAGAFGYGSGKYKAEGNTITTTVDGQPYNTYQVLSLSGSNAEIQIKGSDGSNVGYVKVEKM